MKEKIECQTCGWIGTYDDLIAPTSDLEPGCPSCLGADFLDVENNIVDIKEDIKCSNYFSNY